MSRANLSLSALPLIAILAIGACATTASVPEESAQKDAEALLAEALKPASAEEIAIAERADPLTRANFWAQENRKDPTNLDTSIAFATALRGIGTHDRAAEVASRAAVLHPKSADLMMVLGRALISAGNAKSGAQAFNQAAGIEPERAEAWAALGSALDRLGAHADAQMSYGKSLAIDPTRTNTLANYGLSLALTGDIDAAEAKLRAASQMPGAGPKVRENLALILGLQGKYDDMRAISGSNAPDDIINKNIAVLKSMQQPLRSWEKLVEETENAPIPEAEMLAEVPKKVASVVVSEEPVSEPQTEITPAPPAPERKGPVQLRGSTQ